MRMLPPPSRRSPLAWPERMLASPLARGLHVRREKIMGKPTRYARAMKSPLGSGKRFAAVEEHAKEEGADDPAAVAAAVGRKAHGAKKMAQLAAKGRRK